MKPEPELQRFSEPEQAERPKKQKWRPEQFGIPSEWCQQVHRAVQDDDLKKVWTLLAQGENVNRVDAGYTPLHIAASRPNYEAMIQMLLSAGALMTTKSKPKQYRPIHIAAMTGNTGAINILLDHGDDIEAERTERHFLDETIATDTTPFMDAIIAGQVSVVKLLIERGVNLRNMKGYTVDGFRYFTLTPMFLARENEEIMDILYRNGFRLEPENLVFALKSGNISMVKYYLAHGFDINGGYENYSVYVESTLHIALRAGASSDLINLLLDHGADPELKNNRGLRPLHIAAYRLSREGINILIGKGVDLGAQDDRQKTPLCYCISETLRRKEDDIFPVVKLLLDCGANPLIKDASGQGPQDYAGERRLDTVKLLLLEASSQSPATLKGAEFRVRWYNDEVETSNIDSMDLVRESSRVNFRGGLISANRSRDEWFRDYERFSAILQAQNADSDGYERVKVAIIDSGLIPDSPHLELVQDYQDFIDGDHDNKRDGTLHGTMGLHFMIKVAPEADYYIARVFRQTSAELSTQQAITDAIEHAQDVWKVDVIVLACGFESENGGMRRAIQRASDDDILVFAAASNEGNRYGIAFPARMYGRTLCMFGCDGKSKASTIDFNPAPVRNQFNFAFPGKDIQDINGRLVEGTSIATFVGAAVAAGIIDFSRQTGVKNRLGRTSLLKTVRGISEVFDQMSVEEFRYRCVVPMKLVRCQCQDQKHTIQEKREHLISRLFAALAEC
ncbi:Ankyrin-1 [Arthrobotrys entomopaga]|nr:Ankyrin-1 [Arthrobotrys entomopaga]